MTHGLACVLDLWFCRAKKFKEMCEAQLEFLEGGIGYFLEVRDTFFLVYRLPKKWTANQKVIYHNAVLQSHLCL